MEEGSGVEGGRHDGCRRLSKGDAVNKAEGYNG
jgi:hypothetical protein